jgi:predicted lipoprotein with Yx(FWY)xxD motif
MRHKKRFEVLVLLIAAFAYLGDQPPVAAQGSQMPAGVQARKLDNGTLVLADAKGMTLYTFAKDTAGVSNCAGPCATNWPPLMAAADAKPMADWTIVTRAEGTKMWAYKGMPLYTWIKDTKPGEATGDGLAMGAWKIAVP